MCPGAAWALQRYGGDRPTLSGSGGEEAREERDKVVVADPSLSSFIFTPSGSARVRGAFRSAAKAQALAAHSASGLYESAVGIDAADAPSLAKAFEGAKGAVIVTPMDHARGIQCVGAALERGGKDKDAPVAAALS